jgi:hydroxypyruvate isomerase
MRVQQSICYPLFLPEGTELEALFARAAEIGYRAVELWFRDENLGRIVKAAHDNGLVVASMCGHQSIANGLNNRADHDRIERDMRESIDIAAEHGIPGLICFGGNRRPHLDDNAAADAAADGLRRIAPYAEDKGVNLNMELLNSKVDHPGYQCDHTSWGVAVCEKVNSPRVKLLYDIYHMQIMEGDVIATIRDNIRWIGHFHTAGVPGRHDMDTTQELNYPAICSAIAETDYEYYLGHEFSPKGDRLEALQSAFDLCNQGD